jgi:hypothetical protein
MLMGGAATASTFAVAFGGYFRTFVDVPIWFSAIAPRDLHSIQYMGIA